MTGDCLDGIRVLDLTQYLPGPYATQLLADLGARVVKVEPPAGDPMRSSGAAGADGIAESYKALNAGKTRLVLDLKEADAAARFARLVSAADVLVESYRPGVLDRLGFGRARLGELNGRLIHCALSGHGQTGPERLQPGHDLTYGAAMGALAASGTALGPVVPYPPVSDRAGGLYGALGILGALLRRASTGEGAYIDLAIADGVLAWQSTALAAASITGGVPPRAEGAVNGGAACYQVYRTKDSRFAALSALEERFWAIFCAKVARDDWVGRRWEPYPQTALIGELSELFATRTLAQWQDLLGDADCCFAPVRELAEVAEAPQVLARGMMAEDDGGTMGVLFPALFDGNPPARRTALRDGVADDVLADWEDTRPISK